MKLYVIRGDYANHFIYGLAVAVFASFLASLIWPTLTMGQRKIIGVAAATLVGVAKDYVGDRLANKRAAAAGAANLPHEVSRADVCWTSAGGAAYALITTL